MDRGSAFAAKTFAEAIGALGAVPTPSALITLDAPVLAKAFGVPIASSSSSIGDDGSLLSQLSTSRATGFKNIFIWGVIALIAMAILLDMCSDGCDDVRSTFGASSAEYQQCKRSGGGGVRSGGSFGGYSSGGGHK